MTTVSTESLATSAPPSHVDDPVQPGLDRFDRVEQPAAADPGGNWLARNWPPLLLAVGVASWLIGLRQIDVLTLTGSGVIGQLTLPTLLGYPIVIVGALAELRRPDRRGWVLTTSTLVLLVLVYGLQPAIEPTARFQVAWLHAGFSEYFAQHGTGAESLDTRFSWPGFFAAAGLLSKAAGYDNPAPLLTWAPLVFAGLATLAMRVLARAVFGATRVGWLAIWVFILANWTEQDYFSPQATATFLLLAALALTVRFLVRPSVIRGGGPRWRERLVPRNSAADRVWAQLMVVGFAVALAPTHQLTPFALIGMLTVLLLVGRLHTTWLPALALIPTAAWFILGASDFWQGQLSKITDSVGRVDTSVSKGITQRLAGDPEHQAIVLLRIGLTVAIGALAVAGFVILWRRGLRSIALPALAAVPAVMALVQPYGGEVFVRIYLYGLCWLSLGTAVLLAVLVEKGTRSSGSHALVGRSRSARVRRILPVAVVAVVLSVVGLATVAARGGNDAYVAVTDADTEAMRVVYADAASGDTVASLLWYSPLQASRVGELTVVGAAQLGPANSCSVPERMAGCLNNAKIDFVVINPQQDAAGVILKGFTPGWSAGVRADLLATGRYVETFNSAGVSVLARTGATSGG